MFCIAASGVGRPQAYRLLPLEEDEPEPEGEQIVYLKQTHKQINRQIIGVVRMLEDKGGSIW